MIVIKVIMLKKLIAALIAISGAGCLFNSLSAQDGLAIGGGYRQSLSKMFVPVTGGGHLYGINFGADYTTNDLCGPMDLGIGLNVARTWRAYWDDANEAFKKRFGSRLWSTTCFDLQLPLYIRLSHTFDNAVTPFFQFGPTINLGVSLRDGFRGERYQFDLYKSGVELNPYGIIYNRWDVLVGGSLGCIIAGHYRVMAGFQYGCIKRIKENHCNDKPYFGDDQLYNYAKSAFSDKIFDPAKSHNMQVSVTFAYVFD